MRPLVKSSDRTLAILELLTAQPQGLTLTEIHHALELPKSSTYTLVTTMTARGFIEQDDSRRYRVGIRLWQAGKAYVPVADLEDVARPYMEQVRDALNETVQLAMLDGVDNVYIGKVDPDQQLRLASRVGVRLPAYATAIGKALLTLLDDDEITERFADVEFVRYTPRTVTSAQKLLAIVRTARARGYAEDNGEYTPGVFCVATPIQQQTHRNTAMSVSVPEVRRTPALIERSLAALRSATQQLSFRLGYPTD